MRFGVTMYVEKDLTLAPLIEQVEEDFVPNQQVAATLDHENVQKTFYGRIKLTDTNI